MGSAEKKISNKAFVETRGLTLTETAGLNMFVVHLVKLLTVARRTRNVTQVQVQCSKTTPKNTSDPKGISS